MIIGSHCSMNEPNMLLGSVLEALSYGANALMVYTGAPQSTIRKPTASLKIEEAHELMRKNFISFDNLIVHAPYIMNPATSDIEKRNFCIDFLGSEIIRTERMGSRVIVLHPGNALDQPIEVAIDNVCYVINKVLALTNMTNVTIAIETMAGKGTEVGKTFEEVRMILDKIENRERIGVCLDTCHINDAGYDLVNDYDNVKKAFKSIIGLDMLKVIHLNDSKNQLGAHKDRHANIGEGFIGYNTLKKICDDVDFENIPKILETPYKFDFPPYKEEIEMLRK